MEIENSFFYFRVHVRFRAGRARVALSPTGVAIHTAQGLQVCIDLCRPDTNCYGFNFITSTSMCWLKPMYRILRWLPQANCGSTIK